jgi:glutamyl-tRNA reductase
VRSTELAAALRRIGPLSAEQQGAIEHFSRALMNKFLHEPSVRLKAAAANGRGLGVVDAARYLFALGERVESSESDHPDSTKERDKAVHEETDLNA